MLKIRTFMIVHFFMMALKLAVAKSWTASVLSSWAKKADFRRDVAYELQRPLAKAVGWQICKYCEFAIAPNDPHEYCEEELAIKEYEEYDPYKGWLEDNRSENIDTDWAEALLANERLDEERAWQEHEAVQKEEIHAEEAALDAFLEQQEEAIRSQTDATWDTYQEQLEKEARAAYEKEICPCGHTHAEHYFDEGYCHRHKCDCEYFGQAPEEYETYTITNVGGDKGGFTICE